MWPKLALLYFWTKSQLFAPSKCMNKFGMSNYLCPLVVLTRKTYFWCTYIPGKGATGNEKMCTAGTDGTLQEWSQVNKKHVSSLNSHFKQVWLNEYFWYAILRLIGDSLGLLMAVYSIGIPTEFCFYCRRYKPDTCFWSVLLVGRKEQQYLVAKPLLCPWRDHLPKTESRLIHIGHQYHFCIMTWHWFVCWMGSSSRSLPSDHCAIVATPGISF